MYYFITKIKFYNSECFPPKQSGFSNLISFGTKVGGLTEVASPIGPPGLPEPPKPPQLRVTLLDDSLG